MNGERGATLMETLIAVAITAVLAAAIAQVSGFGLTTLDRAQAASARGIDALRVQRTVAETLARIGRGDDALTGDAETMTWRGVVAGESGGWRAGAWRWRAADGVIARCDDDDCEDIGRFGPAGAVLSYAGPDGAWRDEWVGGPAPHLVRITAAQHTGVPRVIVVAPRIHGAAR